MIYSRYEYTLIENRNISIETMSLAFSFTTNLLSYCSSNTEIIFSVSVYVSTKNIYELQYFTKKQFWIQQAQQESKKKWANQKQCWLGFVSHAVQKIMLVGSDW